MVPPLKKYIAALQLIITFTSVHSFLIPKQDFMEDKRSFYPARDTRATWLDSRALSKEPMRNHVFEELEERWFPIGHHNGRVWSPHKRSIRDVGLNTKGSYATVKLQELDPNQKLQLFKRDANTEEEKTVANQDNVVKVNERASWLNVKRDNPSALTQESSFREMQNNHEKDRRANWRPMKKSDDDHEVKTRANWRPMKKSGESGVHVYSNGEPQNINTRANWRPMKKSEGTSGNDEQEEIQIRANWRPMKKSAEPENQRPCWTPPQNDVDMNHQVNTRASWMRLKKARDDSPHNVQKRATWVKMRDLGYKPHTESRTQHFINGRTGFAPLNAQYHFGSKPSNSFSGPYVKSKQDIYYDPYSKYNNKDSKFKHRGLDGGKWDAKRAMWLPTRDLYNDRMSSQVHYLARRMPTDRELYRRMPTERELYRRMPTERDTADTMPTD